MESDDRVTRSEPTACRTMRVIVASLPLAVCACSAAPSQDILGSFFPSWMLCAVLGIAAAALCRVVLGAVRLNDQVIAPPLSYLAVAIAVTLFIWLWRFGN